MSPEKRCQEPFSPPSASASATVALAVLAVLLSAPAWAGPPELQAEAVFGFSQPERPLPIAVQVTAVDQAADGEVRIPLGEDQFGFAHLLYHADVDVPPGGSKTSWLTLWPDHAVAELPVEYVDRKGRVWRRVVRIRQELAGSDTVLAVVDPSRAGLRYLQREAEFAVPANGSDEAAPGGPEDSMPPPDAGDPRMSRPATRVTNLTAPQLPRDPAAYRALDALIVQGAELTAAEPAVRAAIAAWVRQGGTLVLAGGAASRGLFQDPVVAALAPVKVTGLTEVDGDELNGLQRWLGGRRLTARYAVSQAKGIAGQTLLRAGDVPLVQRARRGRGTVIFVAAPFDQPPLSELNDREGFWAWLLDLDRTDRPPPVESAAVKLWAWQIRAALEIGGVETPSLILVGCFLLAYLLVLVPGQYLVLRKLGRRELAWLLTPAIVAAFSLGAYLIGTSLKGREVVCQSLSLVDAGSGEPSAMAVTTAVIYAPAKARFDVDLPPGTGLVRELADAVEPYGYYGSPSAVLSETGQLRLRQTAGGQRAEQLDIAMWAARVLGFCWTPELPGRVVLGRGPGARPLVRVRNELSLPLQNAVLVDRGRTWRLGTVAAGKTAVTSGPGADSVSLETLLAELQPKTAPPSWTKAAMTQLGETQVLSMDSPDHGPSSGGRLDWLAGTALWAWVTPSDGPLKLAAHKADERTLWLLRVVLEDTR